MKGLILLGRMAIFLEAGLRGAYERIGGVFSDGPGSFKPRIEN